MQLEHKTTGVQFKFIREFKPQFSSVYLVDLLNLKSNKTESFNADTYKKYFTIKYL